MKEINRLLKQLTESEEEQGTITAFLEGKIHESFTVTADKIFSWASSTEDSASPFPAPSGTLLKRSETARKKRHLNSPVRKWTPAWLVR